MFYEREDVNFSKTSLCSFAYYMIHVFCFPQKNKTVKIQKCFIYQNLTDTDSTSLYFFICDLNYQVNEKNSRKIIIEVLTQKYLKGLIYQMIFGLNLVSVTRNLKNKLVFMKLKVLTKET